MNADYQDIKVNVKRTRGYLCVSVKIRVLM